MIDPDESDSDDEKDDKVMAATVRELPSRELDGLWEKYVTPPDHRRISAVGIIRALTIRQLDISRKYQTEPPQLYIFDRAFLRRQCGFQCRLLE
jgi:hypothetical protein